MDTPTHHDLAAPCSVSQMARRLGLSRARFYQLLDRSVFPPPVRSATRRPYYPPDLQQKCFEIRKTGVGANGQPVLFNRSRTKRVPRRIPAGKYDQFVAALKNMGLKRNAQAIEHALQTLYPSGWQDTDPNRVLRDLARHFAPDCPRDV